MTRMRTLNNQLFFNRWKMINLVFLFDLMVLGIIILIDMISNKMTFKLVKLDKLYMYYMLIAFFAYVVSFVLLAKDNERVLFSNKYRMIPITEWKLYLSNMLSSLLALIYFWFLEGIVNTIFGSIQANHFLVGNALTSILYTKAYYKLPNVDMTVRSFIIGFLSITLVWSIVTLVHFLISLISDKFALKKKRVIKYVLYFLITYICLMIFNSTVSGVFVLMYGDGFNVLEKINSMLLTSIFIFIGWIIVLTLMNIYLLKKHIETDY